MPPTASGSTSTDTKPRTKLNSTEQKLNKTGLAAPNRTITQNDLITKSGLAINDDLQIGINTLLRLNLCTLHKDSNGQITYKFVGKEEAKALGSMDSEEKLVLDRIRDADNQGIWTRVLTARTGLPRSTITKVLKSLESKKAIKIVRSVKAPTQKIYMLASLTPSAEITGGPWFTDNELDTEFVDALKKCALKYIESKSLPDPKSSLLYPTSTTIFLPRVSDVRNYITSLNIFHVELLDEHVLSLLELMAFDGWIERVLIRDVERFYRERGGGGMGVNGGKKRKRGGGESDDEMVVGGQSKRKRVSKKSTGGTKGKGKGKGKGKLLREVGGHDDDDEEEEDSDDFDEDEDVESAKARGGLVGKKAGVRRKQRPQKKKVTAVNYSDSELEGEEDGGGGGVTSDSSNSGDEDNGAGGVNGGGGMMGEDALPDDYVWRILPRSTQRIGWTDMPCGRCPVESFCTEATKPLSSPHLLKSRRTTTATTSSSTNSRTTDEWNLDGTRARVPIFLEGTLQGVGMIGGVGAAIGASNERWGDVRGQVGFGVAPVNPRDCAYFREWLEF